MPKPKVLLVGYGNVDRADDGSAWHVLVQTARLLGQVFPDNPEGDMPPLPGAAGSRADMLFQLQLTPELAEILAQYEHVCFIDTHTGSVTNDLNWEIVPAQYTPSPLSHHVTPATCLALTQAVYHCQPQSILVSIRGYEFGFTRQLSAPTAALVEQAAQKIAAWTNTAVNERS